MKKLRANWSILLLVVLLISQNSVVYGASKSSKPSPSTQSTVAISDSTLNFEINEDQNLTFDVIATKKVATELNWTVLHSENVQLTFSEPLQLIKRTGKKISYLEKSSFIFEPENIDTVKTYTYVIEASLDATNKDQITVYIKVNPVTIVKDTFNYVVLGDSIPNGVTHEYLFEPDIDSYSDKLNAYFRSEYSSVSNYSFSDLSVSGLDSSGLLLQLNSVKSYIENADVITVCIGANDIMNAAKNDNNVYDFYNNIDWTKADAGLSMFASNYRSIIETIKTWNNKNVKILVMTVYNPYNIGDMGPNGTGIDYHAKVESYLSDSEIGLNTIIKDLDVFYGTNLDYNVVDVHDYFEKYYGYSKGDVTGFYGILGGYIKDPHPDKEGQAVIFDLHYKVYNNIEIQ